MYFMLFSRKFGNFQGSTMVSQGIFKIPTMVGGQKTKLYTIFVNVVKNTSKKPLKSKM